MSPTKTMSAPQHLSDQERLERLRAALLADSLIGPATTAEITTKEGLGVTCSLLCLWTYTAHGQILTSIRVHETTGLFRAFVDGDTVDTNDVATIRTLIRASMQE